MSLLEDIIKDIKPLPEDILQKTQQRQDNLTKPRGAFGRLEDLSIQIAGIKNSLKPIIKDKAVLVFAGDHLTVHEEGISSAPMEVTSQMVANFVKSKGAGVNVIADYVKARVIVTDVGIASVYPAYPEVINKNIKKGASNITKGPAMSRLEAIKSLEAGIEVLLNEAEKGLDIVAIGEMGIGNTTPSSAIYSIITGKDIKDITGPGAGVTPEKIKSKIEVIKKALEINSIDKNDPIDILAKVGGLEIGAMAGAMLAAASINIPVVVDGFISTAASLIATELAPICKDYLIFSHYSAETGYKDITGNIDNKPLLDLGLRLGEGTGALLGISLAEVAVKILNEMTTFEEAAVIMADEHNEI